MDRAFWQGKRVFLTGHTGFKGSWLSLWLQSVGAELLGFALTPPTDPCLFKIARVAEGMTSVIGDINNYVHLQDVITSFKPEIIIHMAAQTVVHTSYLDPINNYMTNVMGTVHLLEAVRQVDSVRAVVSVTSDKCYDNQEWVWGYRENDALGGYDPYSSSKACAELVTAAYRNSFFNISNYSEHRTAIASARAGNVIGGGDWTANGLIADLVRSFLAQQPILIRNPYATRPWQHVLDALNGYLVLAEHLFNKGPAFAEAWNFGPNEADVKPVGWIADKMLELWGEGASWERDQSYQFHESNALSLNCAKARLKLGWHSQMTLEEGLNQIITWTKGYKSGLDMRALTLDAIHQFMDAA